MKTPKDLAREFGVKTADEVSAPQRKRTPADHDSERMRWGPEERAIFKRLKPSATYIAGARQLVSVTVYNDDGTRSMFGHNRPQRPVRIGYTGSGPWLNAVTKDYNVGPYFWQGLLVRIWTPAEVFSKRLASILAELLMPLGEPTELINRFIALSEDERLDVIEKQAHISAWQSGIPTWDDAGLSSEIARARARFAGRLHDAKALAGASDFILRRAQEALEKRN